jgi:hypothetical protein
VDLNCDAAENHADNQKSQHDVIGKVRGVVTFTDAHRIVTIQMLATTQPAMGGRD